MIHSSQFLWNIWIRTWSGANSSVWKGVAKKDKSSAFRQVQVVNSVWGKKCENILKRDESRTFAIEIHPFLIWHPWVWQYICPEGFWISSNVKSEYLWCFFVVFDSASQYFPFSEFSFYRINFRLTLQWIHIYDDYFNKTESFVHEKHRKICIQCVRVREVECEKWWSTRMAMECLQQFVDWNVVCAEFTGTFRLFGTDGF